jgi:DNA-directed RNA polymerase sigma subunit (sigma70/sigma32)
MANRLPDPWIAHLRKEVQSLLNALSPGEAKALRARFGLDTPPEEDDDEESLRALARELAALKTKR